jgi:hypothetical protein
MTASISARTIAGQDQQEAKVSRVGDQITQLAAAADVYRRTGRQDLAKVLTEQLMEMVDDLPPIEQRILMLILLGRQAATLDYRLCETCTRIHGATCPAGGAS